MIRVYASQWHDEAKLFARYRGLSSDTKPTDGLITGSEFFEVDTGASYYFDELSGEWFPASNASKTPLTGATVTLGSSLTYNGSEQTQTVSTVKIGSTTLTADTDYTVRDNKATLPGTYTLLIVGKGNYAGVLQEEFTVAKASSSISASSGSVVLTEGGDAREVTLTVTGDGALSTSSSDTSAATAVLDGGKVVITPVAEGTATITITMADSDLYEGSTATIGVTVVADDPDPDP